MRKTRQFDEDSISTVVRRIGRAAKFPPSTTVFSGYDGRSGIMLTDELVLKVYFRNGELRHWRECWGLNLFRHDRTVQVPELLESSKPGERYPWIIMTKFNGVKPGPQELQALAHTVAAMHHSERLVEPDTAFERGRLTQGTGREDCFSTFVHGDLSLRNVLITHSGPAVIDFENSGIGCGVRDVIRLLFDETVLFGSSDLINFVDTCLGARSCSTNHFTAHVRDHVNWISSWAPTVDPVLHRRTLELKKEIYTLLRARP